MKETFVASIIFIIVLAVVLCVITVIKVKKDPEKFEKQSNEVNKKVSDVKKTILNNTISWEEAKRRAAAEIELEEKIKAEKRAAKKNKKDNN